MAEAELQNAFSLKEVVVYPSSGLGYIEALETRNDREYLRVKFFSTDDLALLPAATAASLGLRHLTARDEIEPTLTILSDRTRPITSDWKQRIQENQTLLKDGTLRSLCLVLNSLYRRSKVRELPSQEKKMYDAALDTLLDEISYVLKTTREEAGRLVFSMLEAL